MNPYFVIRTESEKPDKLFTPFDMAMKNPGSYLKMSGVRGLDKVCCVLKGSTEEGSFAVKSDYSVHADNGGPTQAQAFVGLGRNNLLKGFVFPK